MNTITKCVKHNPNTANEIYTQKSWHEFWNTTCLDCGSNIERFDDGYKLSRWYKV